ncbi:conserved hypothetical protein [Leishmania mexicana MHOM/GT/2001/U1103]|uniref:Uncharacterized protein n=1 Tax=Leishmania mexicana (strain MHOM/GT/2001/U1103) TaxID=929439 RepID=E9B143_LEIMU|nr:conserved hypothetical protein [Leishmania mexicana MHOM/GT/2001/U1103]CBZ28949.1 conserved hypothetical protein [Leishmania mexicana MHOM/GT/2001/U1103]
MDGDRYIYSRPVVVTEDRIKEALEKQAKQKALKAALDRQVRETERLKAEKHRATGKQDKRWGDPKVNAPPTSSSANAENKTQTASPAVTASVAGPSPPTMGATGAPGAVDSTRYNFSFRKGQGTFKVDGSPACRLQTTFQTPAEVREHGGGAAPPETGGENGKAPAPRARRQPASRDASSGAGPRNSRGSRSTAAASGGEYQTNSLPINFSMAKEGAGKKAPLLERRPSECGRPSCGMSGERGGGSDASGHSRNKGNGGYDTQSLPTELIYKLGQANSNAAVAKPSLRRVKTPLRAPSSGRASEPRRHQSPLGLLTGAVSGSPMTGGRENFKSSLNDRTRSPDWAGVGGGHPRLSPCGGGKGMPLVLGSGGGTPIAKALGARYVSPRPTARLAGGILPPLNTHDDSDVIEMSAVLDAVTPTREYSVIGAATGAPSSRTPGSSAQPLSCKRTNSTPAERPARASPPQSPHDAAAAEQKRKQAEREKAWAQQVKQIKAELRKTRAKGPGKGGMKLEDWGAMSNIPRRAETAPDPAPHPPMRGGLGGAAGGGASGAGGSHDRNGAGSGGKSNVGGGRSHQVEKMDFAKAHIFTRENFRPITAPEDATSYFGMLSPPPSLPPLARAPKFKSREQARVSSELATGAERKEEAMGTEVASPPNINGIHTFASTGTSGEESLKLASLTTRQMTLGLPDYGDSDPVPIQFNHLLEFVEAQIITAHQAENLWDFFSASADVARGGGSGSDVGHAGSSFSVNSARDVWGRAARGDVNGAVGARKSGTLEIAVVDERPAANGVGATEGDENVNGDTGRAFYAPYSPSQLPTPAVLAPALRRKITQQHSEQEAARLHQPYKPLQNGPPCRSPSGAGGRGANGGPGGVDSGQRTSAHIARGLQNHFSTAAELGDEGGDGDHVGANMFDTFSELVRPPT